MHRDRGGDENAEGFAPAERGADTDSFGDRMDRHDRDDEQTLDRVVAAERTEVMSVVRRVQEARHDEDEADAHGGPDCGARAAQLGTLEAETDTRSSHDAACNGIRNSERLTANAVREEQRKRTEPSGQRGEKCDEEDGEGIDRVHVCRTVEGRRNQDGRQCSFPRCHSSIDRHTAGGMAMNPSSNSRPSGRAVVVAFAIAIAAALALVAVALIGRSNSSAPATPDPVVDLSGISQEGRMLGSPDAAVTLIEWADPQCPGCRAYTEEFFPTVVDEYVRPGRVDTEFRGYPFIGDESVKAYRFLLAAGVQNKLWNLQEAMYRNQGSENGGWVTDDLIRELASQIDGLDVDQLFADAERSDIVAEANGASAAGQAAGIRGTPTLLLKIGSAEPYQIQVATVDQLRAALDDALDG